MRLFIIDVQEWEYDCVESVAVLAKDKDKAIELAIEYDDFFKNNIGEIKEKSLTEESVVHQSTIDG
ncbi:MAG TPA: hypothetical protein DDY58_01920 [Terrisporobacter glycolicus]|uniref:hypothetical protein n=1 Tax=Terrisporobacter hibernicus TaxID=2813371 RepID=UPI000E826D18|nr:hypothetical protein [Terrisporobacter hibernicus]HBI91283.1 hypothetical protein [Terrisporobacter hibernicus]